MRVSNQTLAIGIPCTQGWVPTSFFYSFIHLERPTFHLIHADNGGIDALRNNIVDRALELGVSHLLMIDTDMIYHPKTIVNLLAHRLPIVGALCYRRYPPFDPILLQINSDGTGYESQGEWKEGELVEVAATGAGCLLFNMEIFRKMPRPWFKFRRHPENEQLVIGEDVGFCQELKMAGYRIFVDTSVPADHLAQIAINHQFHLLYRSVKASEERRNAAFGYVTRNDMAQVAVA